MSLAGGWSRNGWEASALGYSFYPSWSWDIFCFTNNNRRPASCDSAFQTGSRIPLGIALSRLARFVRKRSSTFYKSVNDDATLRRIRVLSGVTGVQRCSSIRHLLPTPLETASYKVQRSSRQYRTPMRTWKRIHISEGKCARWYSAIGRGTRNTPLRARGKGAIEHPWPARRNPPAQ
jgi:hypothetical protein